MADERIDNRRYNSHVGIGNSTLFNPPTFIFIGIHKMCFQRSRAVIVDCSNVHAEIGQDKAQDETYR
jgi:hypothetical protein